MYGFVEGYTQNPDLRKENALEALLALCRVFGLHYEIKTFEGKWTCKLTSYDNESFITCNSESAIDALNSSIWLAQNSLHAKIRNLRFEKYLLEIHSERRD